MDTIQFMETGIIVWEMVIHKILKFFGDEQVMNLNLVSDRFNSPGPVVDSGPCDRKQSAGSSVSSGPQRVVRRRLVFVPV